MSQDPRSGQDPPPYPYPASGYPADYPAQGHGPRPTNTMAIVSLVFAFVFFPLGIVFGHMARHQIRRSGEDGWGLALAGLIISYIQLAFVIVGFVVALIALVLVGTTAG